MFGQTRTGVAPPLVEIAQFCLLLYFWSIHTLVVSVLSYLPLTELQREMCELKCVQIVREKMSKTTSNYGVNLPSVWSFIRGQGQKRDCFLAAG